MTVEVIGAAEFHQTMLALAKSLPNDKVEPVMMEGAKVIADAAKANAPQGLTGNLKKGIRAKFLKPISLQPRSAVAVSNARHAYLVEYGSPGRFKKKTGKGVDHPRKMGASSGPMPANPYFRRAVDSNKGRIQNQVIGKLWDMILGACK
jgi:HK97 gp10 family phage protein